MLYTSLMLKWFSGVEGDRRIVRIELAQWVVQSIVVLYLFWRNGADLILLYLTFLSLYAIIKTCWTQLQATKPPE